MFEGFKAQLQYIRRDQQRIAQQHGGFLAWSIVVGLCTIKLAGAVAIAALLGCLVYAALAAGGRLW
jgi:hypothetical protein